MSVAKLNVNELTGLSSITERVGRKRVYYDILSGNEKIVFIKSGSEKSARGYKNKYLVMANGLRERLGATVICSSNPDADHYDVDERVIRRVAAERGFEDFETYFIGTSDGGYHNLLLSKRFHSTVKLIGINSSYIGTSELKELLTSMPAVSKIMVYGTLDDDFDEVVPAIKEIENENLTLKLIDGADHDFNGMLDEFIAIADMI